MVGLVGREVWGEEFELPPLDLQEDIEIEQVEVGMAKEIDQGKKRKNKLEDLLRRRRAPQSGSEGEDSDESLDEIFESDTDDDEDISDTCLLDSSSDEELDVVIEAEEEPTVLPSLTELVEAADNTMLLPAIRLCLVWLKDKPEVLGQTCPGSERAVAQPGQDVHPAGLAGEGKHYDQCRGDAGHDRGGVIGSSMGGLVGEGSLPRAGQSSCLGRQAGERVGGSCKDCQDSGGEELAVWPSG